MVQLQAICNILDNNNIEKYLIEGITSDYFEPYEEEFNFIHQHYRVYDKVPDLATFLGQYPDFKVVEVLEPTKYIIKELKDDYLFKQFMDRKDDVARQIEQEPYTGINAMITMCQQLLQSNDIKYGSTIKDMKEELIQDIKKKRKLNNEGIIGVSSGFSELDNITHGWLPGNELVTIVGRVNQGKSWVLQKFLTEANKQGKKVLLYSGEMSKKEVINRHITLKYGISNTKLMTGDMTDEELEEYAQLLDKESDMFKIITPSDLGGKQITVTRLKMLAMQYKPDIIGIDQLSLMQDERKQRGDGTKEQYAHISQDLFNLSGLLEVPILLAVQANRGRTSEDKVENPELSNIANSDDVACNSSRVISLATKDGEMTLKLIKNRYGQVGWKDEFPVNFDTGDFNAYASFRRKPKPKEEITDEF